MIRRWSVALLLAVGLSGCSGGNDHTDATCHPIQIVGLRGQGQSLKANNAMGTEVAQVVDRIADELPNGEVESTAVRYPNSLDVDLDGYLADVARGQVMFATTLERLTQRCPEAKIVVIGFSQGSQVAREGLAARPDLAAKVSVLTLIASPVRDPASPFHRVDLPGEEPTQSGSLGPGPALGDLADRTVEACVRGDNVCAYRSVSPPDVEVHRRAYEAAATSKAIAQATLAVLNGH